MHIVDPASRYNVFQSICMNNCKLRIEVVSWLPIELSHTHSHPIRTPTSLAAIPFEHETTGMDGFYIFPRARGAARGQDDSLEAPK